jgi:2-polyprenyl-3-methyl-5-hydroxy-6-metoxy-1,4-benzoquinol methylase
MFKHRSKEVEIMDDLNIQGDVIDSTLKELNVINTWLGGNAIIVDALGILLKNSSKKNITLADIGCGGGDILKLISNWLKRNDMSSKLVGIDANPPTSNFSLSTYFRRSSNFRSLMWWHLRFFSTILMMRPLSSF